MYSVSKYVALLLIVFATSAAVASTPALRVCEEANDLPFSNLKGQGFQNILAKMVAHDLHRNLVTLWLPQQAEKIEKAIHDLNCDIVMGATSPSGLMALSVPYYRSSYVFVSRRDRHIVVSSLSDPALAKYRIGAHLIGDDDATVPPAQELVRRGLVRNIVGYSIYGHPISPNPSSELIGAVARGDVDMAVAWGPLAGYFSKKSAVPLRVTPICNSDAAIPVAFSISMGVRRGKNQMLAQVNRIIERRQKRIRALLTSYGVPLLSLTQTATNCR